MHPFSFLLAIVEDNQIKRMLCKNKKIKDLDDDRQAVVFAMQIDPQIFEQERDQAAFAKLTEEAQAVVSEENDDHNNGVKKDWVKVVFHMSRMEKSKYSYYSRKSQFSFPRVLWLHKDSTLAEVHRAAFAAFRYPFDEAYRKMKDEGEVGAEEFLNMSNEEAFGHVFEGLDEESWKENMGFNDKHGKYSYSLLIMNPYRNRYFAPECPFCGSTKCENCALPYSSTDKLWDTMQKMKGFYDKKNDPRKAKVVDNNHYFFVDEDEYETFHDFEIEVFWGPQGNCLADQDRLNRCLKHASLETMEKKASEKSDDAASLYDCLDTFRTPEQLGEDNAWYCRTCKEHVQAKKKLDLFNVPPVLVISLKRFKSSRGGYFKDKLTDKVDFPVKGLDLTQYVCNNADNEKVVYDLYAVSNHYGNMGFGHYTAYGYNVEHKQWYDYDDGHVSPLVDS